MKYWKIISQMRIHVKWARFFGLAAQLALVACTGTSADTDTDSDSETLADTDTDTEDPCRQLWQAELSSTNPAQVIAEVADGGLTVSIDDASSESSQCTTSPDMDYKLFQSNLTGDFSASWTYDSASFSAMFDKVLVFVGNPTHERALVAYASIDYLNPTTFGVDLVHIDEEIVQEIAESSSGTATDGSLQIRRVGDQITLTTTVGPYSKTLTDTFGTEDLIIGMGVTNAFDTPSQITVRFTDFAITGGGGAVLSDSFDCNTLKP